jgi:hypothetical protein
VRPIIDEIRRSGAVTLWAIADALNARGVQTARGGRWHAESVARVLSRWKASLFPPALARIKLAAPGTKPQRGVSQNEKTT